MSDMTSMNTASLRVLWQGSSNDLSSMTTGGRVSGGSYVVTEDAVQFARGVMSNREESIPLWAVIDVDIIQTMAQKARGVADVRLKIDPAHIQRFGQGAVIMKSIREPHQVRDIVARQANYIRHYWAQRAHEKHIEAQRAGAMQINNAVAVPAAPFQQPAQPVQPAQAAQPTPELSAPATTDAGDDMIAKLEKLGSLHAAGVLTDEEFAAAKAKLLA